MLYQVRIVHHIPCLPLMLMHQSQSGEIKINPKNYWYKRVKWEGKYYTSLQMQYTPDIVSK